MGNKEILIRFLIYAMCIGILFQWVVLIYYSVNFDGILTLNFNSVGELYIELILLTIIFVSSTVFFVVDLYRIIKRRGDLK